MTAAASTTPYQASSSTLARATIAALAAGAAILVLFVLPAEYAIDPTGVGDAFRGGLLKGLAAGWGLEAACRVGSVAATYALEHLGGQSHAYSWEEFRERYERQFGPL